MRSTFTLLLAFLLISHAHAQVCTVSPQIIQDTITYLSSDALEGRAPGTPGELLAAQYIQQQMSTIGLKPAFDNPQTSYIQPVPLFGSTLVSVNTQTTLTIQQCPVISTLQFFSDWVGNTDLESNHTVLNQAAMIFVGYGIIAPEFNWNDYKNVNVTNKIVISFVNQPAAITNQTQTLSYYGRWTYKYEQARQLGAAGVILIHTDATAGYDWGVVQNSNSGEQLRIHQDLPSPLTLRAWMSSSVADQLAHCAGVADGLNGWFAQAELSTFQPQPLTTTVSTSLTYSQRSFEGKNVVGYIPGQGDHAQEHMVVMGHLDHLGAHNNQIFHGALDNASGVGMMLALAQYLLCLVQSNVVTLERSIVFLSPTGEETGLLGSSYHVTHPSDFFPIEKTPNQTTIAAFAFDIGNAWGATKDMVVLGSQKSTLGNMFEGALNAQGMFLSQDPIPSTGFFFRSDHFSYAKYDVPSVWVTTGTHFTSNTSSSYYEDVVIKGYFGHCYHQPCDIWNSTLSTDGMLQQVSITTDVIVGLAVDPASRPECYSHCY